MITHHTHVIRLYDPRDPDESRWRDGSGVVHRMSNTVYKGSGRARTGWQPICGAHRNAVAFCHRKRCPLPVSCIGCIGYESPYPR